MTKTLQKSNTLTIGVFMHPWAKAFAVHAQRMLKEVAETDSLIAYYPYKRELTQAILNGSVHVACTALRDLPTALPNGLVIGALSKRTSISNNLVIASPGIDNQQLFSLKEQAQVCVNSNINKAQLLSFRPDLNITITDESPIEVVKNLQSSVYDACLFTDAILNILELNEEAFHIVRFNPKELIPEAGQGVAAFLTSEADLTARRLLKLLHNPSVAQVTNVERKVKSLFNDTNIAAYCEKDQMGNFHMWATAIVDNQLKSTRLSQSTNFGLADNCKNLLLS